MLLIHLLPGSIENLFLIPITDWPVQDLQLRHNNQYADTRFLESSSFAVKDSCQRFFRISQFCGQSTKAHERIACSTHSSTVDAESSFTLTYLLFRSLALYPSNFTIKTFQLFFLL
ncbi:hypothetical protein RIR_jg17659.t1 [Rhizophagus irregularis DAOM 181602=DAOM 197198]|nr:hypothetical protein RIR_jg17659.t1 [Rhizophagus irregularis DAOM 181602=DAOM 197198]